MPLPDTILQGRYRIVRQLGRGGMGTVYEAIDQRLDATVALKETHFADEQLSKQFEREARLLARLHHAALPKVIDHFSENEGQFLVMGFVEGEDLWAMLHKRGAFAVEKVLTWADQLLDALDYLHTQEPPIIHRDIKPQNLKLTSRGQIILLDFGLAKGYAGQISRVTTSGSIFGYTPNYAPLEQIQGTGTDARSDLYALAATLYHLMTGVSPPDVITRVTATTDGASDPLPSADRLCGSVTRPVADAIHKAMSVGRSQRFASASEMRYALRRASETKRDANPDLADAETLPPTLVDESTPEPVEASDPKIASSPAPSGLDDATAREREALRLREAEEAVHRAAQERQRQEDEARQRREAEEAQRKAEIRRRREEEEQARREAEEAQRQAEFRRQREERHEPSPVTEKATSAAAATESKRPARLLRRWKVLAVVTAIVITVVLKGTESYQYYLLGEVGIILIFPFANALILGIAFGLPWPRKGWIVGLIVGISYSTFQLMTGGFLSPFRLLAVLVGVFAGAHLGAFIIRRGAEKSPNPVFFITK